MGFFGGTEEGPEIEKDTLRSVSFARVVDLVSEGPIQGPVGGLQGVYYGKTPVLASSGSLNFPSAQVDWRLGTVDQAPLTLVPFVEEEQAVGQALTFGDPVTVRVTDLNARSVRVTIALPSGLMRLDSTGDQRATEVRVDIFQKSADDGDYQFVRSAVISGKTVSPFTRAYEFMLNGPGPWDIQLVRDTGDNWGGSDQARHWDTAWSSMTVITGATVNYAWSAIFAHVFDASQIGSSLPERGYLVDGRILQVPTNYDPVDRAYSGVWDGTFKDAFSNNPAWVFYDICTNSRYGLGQLITPSLVDKWALYAIGQYCDELVDDGSGGLEPRFQCNCVLGSAQDAYDVLTQLASVFRGMVHWLSGVMVPVPDSPADPMALFSPTNVVDGLLTYQGAAIDSRHTAVRVSWLNPVVDYDVVKELIEDEDLIRRYGYRVAEITAFACTTRGQAVRAAKWMLETESSEAETVSFKTALNAAWIVPGSIIAVSDPLRIGKRVAGRAVSATTTSITLDAPVDVMI